MTVSVVVPPRLRVRTTTAQHPESLLDLVPAGVAGADVFCWLREGDGLVGWGRAAVCTTQGPERFADAEVWWAALTAGSDTVDEVHLPGTGMVAFGAFSFADGSPTASTLVVPQVLAGRRDGRCWVTVVEPLAESTTAGSALPLAPTVAPPPGSAHRPAGGPAAASRQRDGAVPAARWPQVIAGAVARIEAGEVDKVVLARDVVVEVSRPLEATAVLERLAGRYAATWVFAVDGLIGATPEMLVRLQDGVVRSRVLAGTLRRDGAATPEVTESHPDLTDRHTSDPRIGLISSSKDLDEHAFAVRSVADALRPHCTRLSVPDEPFVLDLPDVYHLASDLSGVPRPGATSLRLAAALHPSAAVCGTPAAAAARMIDELEQMDRGRYTGPVGWLDADGGGDWGIALRCGQLAADQRSVRLFAGGGIVSASDPQAELEETEVKLAAMRYGLGL